MNAAVPQPYSRMIPESWTLPPDLVAMPAWCAWRLVQKEGKQKPDKVPVSPRSGSSAGWAKNPAAFCASFEEAASFARADSSLHGVGIILQPESGLIGGDLDGCTTATNEPNPLAARILAEAATYTELSPGLNGYRFIAKGTFGGFTGNDKAQGVELYESGRFLTITGLHVPGTPQALAERGLSALGRRFFGKQEPAQNADLPPVPEKVDLSRFDLKPHVVKWITQGTEKGTRSERLLQVAKDLYRAGASVGEILQILSNPENGIAAKALEERSGDIASAQEWLFSYTVKKAVALVDAEPKETAAPIDIRQHQAANLLAVPPPVQRYVVQDLLPEPIAAAIVAPGGTGKSFWLMQLAAAVASGSPFMGCEIPKPGGVLMLAAEDDRAEIARRLHSIVSTSLQPFEGDQARVAIGRNFYPVSRLADDNRITIKGADGSITTNAPLVDEIITAAKQVPDLRLIILDPVSRFRAGEENASEDNTRFVEALERIRKETGVTVLVAHHSRKGSDGETQDSIRGSSAFVDALRWAATLTVPAKLHHLPESERKKLVRFTLVKSNYRVTLSEKWFKRGEGGALEITSEPKKLSTEAVDRQRYAEALPLLKETIAELAAKGKKVSKRYIADTYGGLEGRFEAGEKKVRGFIERALLDGQLLQDEKGCLTVNTR